MIARRESIVRSPVYLLGVANGYSRLDEVFRPMPARHRRELAEKRCGDAIEKLPVEDPAPQLTESLFTAI